MFRVHPALPLLTYLETGAPGTNDARWETLEGRTEICSGYAAESR